MIKKTLIRCFSDTNLTQLKSFWLIWAFLLCYVLLPNSPAGAMTFDQLQELITKNNIYSIEQLLSQLPESLRSQYALVFKSRSLQDGTFTNPRAIVFSDNGKFIFSFNGDHTQKGYYAFETAEFNEHSKKFVYREIIFSDQLKHPPAISQANPDKCTKCHGMPLRPLWDTHPLWPGAYGERYHSSLSPPEQEGIDRFLQAQPSHPRYRYLLHPEIFSKKETFNPSHQDRYEAHQRISPNEELSRFLAKINTQRVLELVKNSASFAAYQYALLASLRSECGNIEPFVPNDIRDPVSQGLAAFQKRTDERNIEQDRLKSIRTVSKDYLVDGSTSVDRVTLSPFRFLVENGLGLSTAKWTTALEAETYDFTAPQPIGHELEALLLGLVTARDPEIKKAAIQAQVNTSDAYCALLKRKSLAALAQLPPFHFNRLRNSAAANGKPDLEQCASCHDGTVGPELPFSNPKRLALLLGQNKYPRGTLLDEIIYRLSEKSGNERMPRGLNLNEIERHDLENYFRELQKRTPAQE